MKTKMPNSRDNNNAKESNQDRTHRETSAQRIYCDETRSEECFSVVASVASCCVLAVCSFSMQFADTKQLTAFDHLAHFELLKQQNTLPYTPGSATGITSTRNRELYYSYQCNVKSS